MGLNTPHASDGTLPLAPSLDIAMVADARKASRIPFRSRLLLVCLLCALLAVVTCGAAQLLIALIRGITNLAFFGTLSLAPAVAAHNNLGLWVIGVPVVGGLVVGLMARFGSSVIRGDGIPEVMKQVLYNESRIPARMTFLKPVSSAVAIGTGGPFGAEGPIIATGGALGSLLGQMLHTTPDERKIFLASGAAAGVTSVFGSPIAAVMLAIELLLFEYRARSMLPVALASATAYGCRLLFEGATPMFPIAALSPPDPGAILGYTGIGAIVGLCATGIVWAFYVIEDGFEHLPIHWMWWPALGSLVVGIVGYIEPRTLSIGYENIDQILSGQLAGSALGLLVGLKLTSWLFALGSGTAGGTLAPLFTVGGGLGALFGGVLAQAMPRLGIDVRMAALVSMAALFTAASRALVTSILFACESTGQAVALGPLLGACTAAFLVAHMIQRNSLMTETLARRGSRVPSDYTADHLDRLLIKNHATAAVHFLQATQTLQEARAWLQQGGSATTHHHYPVIDAAGRLVGTVPRRMLQDPDTATAPSSTVGEAALAQTSVLYGDQTLREAVTAMAERNTGALPVVERSAPSQVVGILSSRDIRTAVRTALQAAQHRRRTF